jgi:L,D-transpeptidase catalytic domain
MTPRDRPMLHNAAVSRRAGIAITAAALLALPAASASAATGPPTLELNGPKKPGLLDKVTASGTLPGAAAGDIVTVTVEASGRTVEKQQVDAGNGKFAFPFMINACCSYQVTATSVGLSSHAQRFSIAVPRRLRKGGIARLYNESLVRQGYYIGRMASRVTLGTRLATLAFRKVNGMGRSMGYRRAIFRKLLMGRGAFQPQFDDGHHVEADLSRQVMALVEGDKPVATFHISSGTGGTPTVRGNFRFYLKQPGYNSKRMYYSVYFIGGYATHGYNPVPNHPASHGCIRNPIPFSRFIYDWIRIGDPMHVYG